MRRGCCVFPKPVRTCVSYSFVRPITIRAAEAVASFCYQAKNLIGAYAAALGGLDTLVFAGGIRKNSAIVRERICQGLGFLGIELSQDRNAKNAPLISAAGGRVNVRVI
jgi:acetate kinase